MTEHAWRWYTRSMGMKPLSELMGDTEGSKRVAISDCVPTVTQKYIEWDWNLDD